MLTSYADANVQLGLPILDAENEATDYPWPVQLMSIPGEDGLEELGPVVAIACGLDSSYVTMQVCVCVFHCLSLARSLALCLSRPMSRCMCVCLAPSLARALALCCSLSMPRCRTGKFVRWAVASTGRQGRETRATARYSVYLLYECKSTNTDA